MIAVTGSTGHLGRLVIDALLDRGVAPDQVVAIARSPAAAAGLAARGVLVREGDYDRPETLGPALDGVRRLLLISGSDAGKRVAQHRAVIDAARAAGVELVAYTSLLHADTSAIGLAESHRQTEAMLAESGRPYVVLRNGWYTENYTGSIGAALAHGAVLGSAGDAVISAAPRRDYAEAAAAVLAADEVPAGQTYELAGPGFTLAAYAAEVTRQSGTQVDYVDLPEDAYRDALVEAGLPGPVAAMLAQSDVAARGGALEGSTDDLDGLLGRPATPMPEVVAEALAARDAG